MASVQEPTVKLLSETRSGPRPVTEWGAWSCDKQRTKRTEARPPLETQGEGPRPHTVGGQPGGQEANLRSASNELRDLYVSASNRYSSHPAYDTAVFWEQESGTPSRVPPPFEEWSRFFRPLGPVTAERTICRLGSCG